MGGLLCWARRSAILQFDIVPIHPEEAKKFDAQMRVLYAAPGITESLLSDESEKMAQICETLSKATWTQIDRQFLLDTVERLYE